MKWFLVGFGVPIGLALLNRFLERRLPPWSVWTS